MLLKPILQVFLIFLEASLMNVECLGYNTEQRPNHQVVKFLNAVICVPTVSCGYKIVPKNLEVREYKAQTKQILSNIFSPSFHPDAAECPWQASMLWPSRGMCLCLVSWAASHLPGRCQGTWQRWPDLTFFAQFSEWRATNILLPKSLSSSVFLSKNSHQSSDPEP